MDALCPVQAARHSQCIGRLRVARGLAWHNCAAERVCESVARRLQAGAMDPAVLCEGAVSLQRSAYLLPQRTNDSCGVRTHALTDWRLEPAP